MHLARNSHTATMPHLPYINNTYLFFCLSAITPVKKRLRGDQIESFQILNGSENIDRHIFTHSDYLQLLV